MKIGDIVIVKSIRRWSDGKQIIYFDAPVEIVVEKISEIGGETVFQGKCKTMPLSNGYPVITSMPPDYRPAFSHTSKDIASVWELMKNCLND